MPLEGTNPFPPELIERYTARKWWSDIPLGLMLDRTCDLYPDKEALVAGHPAVGLVAVVGMPDPVLGERVCAFVKTKADRTVTCEDIVAFLKAKSTSVLYLPERIEVVAEIPLTPVGKIDKKKLREDIRIKVEAETAPGAR